MRGGHRGTLVLSVSMTLWHVQVQHDINPVMRGILVDWLVEVAEEYKLTAESELRPCFACTFCCSLPPPLSCFFAQGKATPKGADACRTCPRTHFWC